MTTDTLTQPTHEYGADALIVCDNLVRIYQVENIEVQALQGLDLLVDKGEMVAIVGQSGSGKSTLLNVLSGLDVPTAGASRVAGWDLLRMSHADRLTYRRSVVGFVWQQTGRNLLSYLNAKENVMLPMAFAGATGKKRAARALELLDAMGMADKAGRRPNQLSGGEQQRVAIAVALANSPEVIFADEPTGELDSATGDDVFEALRAANRDLGATVVVVTHDHAVSSQVQRTVAIRDGRTATEVVRRTHVDDEGVTQTIHEEYAVLDRAGRMQLPRDYRTALGLKDRVRLELESDHIGVWADGSVKKVRHETVVATPAEPEAAPVADVPAATPLAVSPYLAPSRPVVESPSKPPAPVTGQVPVVVEPAVADAVPADPAVTDNPATPPAAPPAPASGTPRPLTGLAGFSGTLDDSPPTPYTPRIAAPASPADDPYAPPAEENSDD
jgi:ABC-type lipoprotein export system ATPase subunit